MPLSLILLAGFFGQPKMRPVAPENLVAYHQAYLRLAGDTLLNCDTGSSARILRKLSSPVDDGKSRGGFDAWASDSGPVTGFTYLKRAGDSLYFLATVRKNASQDQYVSFCVERRFIVQAFAEGPGDMVEKHERHEGREGHGGRHRGRRGGGDEGGGDHDDGGFGWGTWLIVGGLLSAFVVVLLLAG